MAAARGVISGVPRPFEIIAVGGRPGLVMERVVGTDMLTLLSSRPWRMRSYARRMALLHVDIHRVVAPPSLPQVTARLRDRIAATSLPEPLRSFALQVLSTLRDGDRVCHGDYHPGNIIMSPTGPIVIDWTNATRGDPISDVARTIVLLRIGAPPPGASFVLRGFIAAGRALFLRAYQSAYTSLAPLDHSLLRRWIIAHAAARPAEGIGEERGAILRLIESYRERRADGVPGL